MSFLLNQYSRTYQNFDKCMECIENIILIAKEQNNFEICKPIETLLNNLERKNHE